MIVESYEDVIVLSGALRSNFWETIHTAISLMLKRHPTGVVIDCSGITEVTQAGADTFRDVMAYIEEHDARIIVAAVSPAVMEVLKSVPEVRSQLAVAGSVEEARRSLDLLAEMPEKVKRKHAGLVEVSQKLIVCLLGLPTDRDALEVVSEIADTIHAEVYVMYVVQIPRHLPLQSPLPAEEEEAYKALGAAKTYLTGRRVAHKENIERARDVPAAVQQVLEEVDASHLVLPLSPHENDLDSQAKLVKTILSRVSQTVVFVRGAR